jgi:hypothetical protein
MIQYLDISNTCRPEPLPIKMAKQLRGLNRFSWVPSALCVVCKAISVVCNTVILVPLFGAAPRLKDVLATGRSTFRLDYLSADLSRQSSRSISEQNLLNS